MDIICPKTIEIIKDKNLDFRIQLTHYIPEQHSKQVLWNILITN